MCFLLLKENADSSCPTKNNNQKAFGRQDYKLSSTNMLSQHAQNVKGGVIGFGQNSPNNEDLIVYISVSLSHAIGESGMIYMNTSKPTLQSSPPPLFC
jgi:hypothetical protein